MPTIHNDTVFKNKIVVQLELLFGFIFKLILHRKSMYSALVYHIQLRIMLFADWNIIIHTENKQLYVVGLLKTIKAIIIA